MFRIKSAIVGLLLIAVNIVSYGVDLQNSQCLDTDDWVCLKQGKRICEKLQSEDPDHKCGGKCYGCSNLPDTLPKQMCFDVEGQTCKMPSVADPFICAFKRPDSDCIVKEDLCICYNTKAVDGTCNFTGCNPADQ